MDITLHQAAIALSLLEVQLKAKGFAGRKYHSIFITGSEIMLKIDGQTLRIPLIDAELAR